MADNPVQVETVIARGKCEALRLHHSNFLMVQQRFSDFADMIGKKRKTYEMLLGCDTLNVPGLSLWDLLDEIDEQQQLQPGVTVCKQGDIGDCMYFIDKGKLNVFVDGVGQVSDLGTGDFFGEVALLSDDSKRTATVTVAEETHVLRLGREGFNKVMAQHADFQQHVRDKRKSRRQTVTVHDDISVSTLSNNAQVVMETLPESDDSDDDDK